MNTAIEWSAREPEFTKRAGFALMAWITVHRKDVSDAQLERFLPLIHRQATDDRNYVKKAVNWALRRSASAASAQREGDRHRQADPAAGRPSRPMDRPRRPPRAPERAVRERLGRR